MDCIILLATLALITNLLCYHYTSLFWYEKQINNNNYYYISCLLKQTENADYDPSRVPEQILFNISNNGTKQCFNVRIIDDNEPEDTENFMLTFDTPLNSQPEDPPVNLSPRMFNVAITDNDEGNR